MGFNKDEKTRFEKRFDVVCYGFVIIALLYFGGRVFVSCVWGI